MIFLANATDKISLITDSTANVDVVTSFVDRNQTTGAVGLANNQLTKISTAATTDIVPVPAATTTRSVKTIHVRNRESSTNNMVTIQYDANGTLYKLWRNNLLAGECLEYVDGVGFFKIPNSSRFNRTMVTPIDQIHATAASFADILGLTCPLIGGRTYNFLAHIMHISGVTTSGARFGVNIGATPTFLQLAGIDTVTAGVQAAVMSYGATQGLNAAVITQTTGAVAMVLGIFSGCIIPSADGTFAMRAASEETVANGLVIKQGSWLKIWEPSL